MSIVLSAYTANAFCEFLLPAINNTDTEIVLKKNIFSFADDVVLKLEVVNREWFLRDTDRYHFTMQQGQADTPLENGDILTVHEEHGNKISLIVRETECSFYVFRKYDISSVDSLTIGSQQGNRILYQYLSLVSKQHACLRRTSRGFCVEDGSVNGTFVNGKRVAGTRELKIGDDSCRSSLSSCRNGAPAAGRARTRYRAALVMEDASRGRTFSRRYLGFRFITATPWVDRVVLGARRAVWKIRARGSVENTASSRSASIRQIQDRGNLSE